MAHRAEKQPPSWLDSNLGRQVTLEGKATNRKEGAHLSTSHGSIYIDGLESWPAGYYLGGQDGRMVSVTGTLIKRYDLPVFENKPNLEAPPAGIPVPPGTDLHEAAKRYLLTKAVWRLVE